MVTPLPVLWLCGAPGTGKSTVAWQLFTDLGAEGERVAHVDIDQLGMLLPAPERDPHLSSTKAYNLAAVIDGYRGAGARALILSGVLDPVAMPTFVQACAGTGTLTFCNLTLDEPTIRARLRARSWPDEAGDASVVEMRALSMATGIHATVGTSGRTVAEVVSDVRPLLRWMPTGPDVLDIRTAATELQVTVICGPRCVGKSSVSWSMFMQSVGEGIRTGYVDLEQITFVHPIGNMTPAMKVRNLFGLVKTFEAQGAKQVIVNGHVDAGTAGALRHHGNVRIIRLTATEGQLQSRIAARALGGNSPRLGGDDLLGASENYQAAVPRTTVEHGTAVERGSFQDLLVETSSDPKTVAAHIAQSTP